MATGKAFLSRAVDGLREQGRLGMLAQALVHHAWVATHTGDWKEAMRDGTEAATLARDTQQPQFGVTGELVAALASALRGEDIETMLAERERALLEAGAGPLLAPVHLARGAMAAGEGRHEDAFRHLLPVFDEKAPAFHRFMRWSGVLDLVEAGGRVEHGDWVVAVVDELRANRTQERRAGPADRSRLREAVARGRGGGRGTVRACPKSRFRRVSVPAGEDVFLLRPLAAPAPPWRGLARPLAGGR